MGGSVAAPEVGPWSGASEWRLRHGGLSLAQPLIVGILNVTPDSFSDGGQFPDAAAAVRRARELVGEGAGMIDVGGESTRPGAVTVEASEESARVIPIIQALKSELAVPISVDTRKAEVARLALAAGADVINDVSALGDPEMAAAVAEAGAGLVLMHMRGQPATMQESPHYEDVAAEVREELRGPLEAALRAGVEPERIVLDPGIGFAKDRGHNLELLARLPELMELGRPLMLGASRKAFIGALLGGVPAAERGAGTAGACVAALMGGVRIFRVHDVRLVREALVVAEAIRSARTGG